MPLNCPKCAKALVQLEVQGVTIDFCRSCQGVWTDPGELAKLRGAPQDLPATGATLATERHPSTWLCPRCQVDLLTYEYTPDSDLFVDRCPHCQGIWLDGGELTRVRQITDRRRLLGLESVDADQARLCSWARQHQKLARRTAADEEDRPRSSAVYFFQVITGLPVEVSAPRTHFPIVTLALILANVGAYLYASLLLTRPGQFLPFTFVPSVFWHGGNWPGLFTSMFLHSGALHLLPNIYFLWLFGDNVEDRLGPLPFLLFYIFCGVSADLIHGALTTEPTVPTLGASGAISGVMGAYLVLYPRNQLYQIFLWIFRFKVSVVFYSMLWLGFQIWFSLQGDGSVAWHAHIGGFLIGATSLWLFKTVGALRAPATAKRSPRSHLPPVGRP